MNNSIAAAMVSRRIFTQTNREITENSLFRVVTTYIGKGNLFAIRDITLGALQHLDLPFDDEHILVILPVTGAVTMVHGSFSTDLVPGESQLISGEKVTVINPYEQQLVNLLVIGIVKQETNAAAGSNPHGAAGHLHQFDINGRMNELVSITSQPVEQIKLSIGKFSARQDYSLSIKDPHPATFFFVLEGAFEAAECLLEDRDGLFVHGTSPLEWEALSDHAILLVLEQGAG